MATEWNVEGTGRETRIRARCSVCHTVGTFHDELPGSMRVFCLPFVHNGCEELVEPIPSEVQEEYSERAVGSLAALAAT
jgi:hypothetical protein